MSKRTPAPHELPPEEQLVAKIEEVRKERARLVKLQNTATAVGGTHKLEAELLRELREIRAPKSTTPTNPAAELSDEDLWAGWCAAAADAPDAAIEAMERALQVRRTGKPSLTVVEGG